MGVPSRLCVRLKAERMADKGTAPDTPAPPTDATPGARWAYRAVYEPARIATVAGVVTVRVGTYARFTLTAEGWVHDNAG